MNSMETPKILIGDKFVDGVIPLINETKHSIDIIVYDWRVYPNSPAHPVNRLTSALVASLLRGVSVRALVNSKQVRDYLISVGIKAKILNSSKILHAKSMILDNRYVICGSHNYTQGGMMLNHEISLVVDLQSEQNDLVSYFNNLFGV